MLLWGQDYSDIFLRFDVNPDVIFVILCMRNITIILILTTFLLSLPKPDNYSIGMNETMGLYGFYNVNYYLDELKPFFITAGAFVIPTIGGVGLGWKRNYSKSRFSLFTAASGVGIYILPALCSTNNCGPKFDMLLSASTGVDIHVIKKENFDLYFQFGVITQYSVFEQTIDDSPSDIPDIWPVINIKIIK